MWLCVDPMRLQKTRRIMHALRAGLRGCGRVCVGEPPNDAPFVVWGHRWLAERIVPPAIAHGVEWWLVDNGYHLPAGGQATGYYSLTLNGVAPVVLPDADTSRLPVAMAPWREKPGGHVILAIPGSGFGRMLGIDTHAWVTSVTERIRQHTDRPIVVREKQCSRPLGADLAGAHVLVTHSSKVAVDAVRAGVPVIVEPTNPAAPVGSTDLADIENPPRPDRSAWWASLMEQQFTLNEMASGYCWAQMRRIRETAGG